MIFSCVVSFFVYTSKIPDLSLPPCRAEKHLDYYVGQCFGSNLDSFCLDNTGFERQDRIQVRQNVPQKWENTVPTDTD